MQESKRNVFLNPLCLMLVQLIGLVVCGWLKYYDITPMADAMGRSERWDFTVDVLGIVLILAPAVVAFVKKVPHWRYPVALACVPAVLLVLAMGYFITTNQVNLHKAKMQRKAVFDSAAKVGEVMGISFPAFKVSSYEEKPFEEAWLLGYICKSEIKFDQQPSEHFFQTLDSLCKVDAKWKKSDNTYVFDSIQGRSVHSAVFLSFVLTRGEKNAHLEYDIANRLALAKNGFFIKY